MIELMIENGKYTQCDPKKPNLFEIPLRSGSGLLMSLQKAVQMERQWEQNVAYKAVNHYVWHRISKSS